MIVDELVKLTPSALIELYILDVNDLSGAGPLDYEDPGTWDGMYRFYNMGLNELESIVIWQEEEYIPFPIEVSGYAVEGEKQTPRPTLSVSNLDSLIQDLVVKYDDLLGGRVIRKRTFAKFLDSVNFCDGNPYADPEQELPETVFYVNKKLSENIDVMSFELSSPWDVDDLKLPRRVMTSNTCSWQYRGSTCGYNKSCTDPGDTCWDYTDTPVNSIEEDVCSKRIESCRLRFPGDIVIPFGAFPAIRRG